jgi:O-antigen ligase
MGAILTPHNAYLAVFGESGVVGFACYVFILLYLGLYQCFVY